MNLRYPEQVSLAQMNFLDTHDVPRFLSYCNGDENRYRLAVFYMMMAMGIPSVFYGDEAGLEGYRDPFCRRPFPWHRMEPTLLEAYRTIGRIRQRESILYNGEYRVIQCTPEFLVFVRTPFGTEPYFLCVAVNLSDHPARLLGCTDAQTILALPKFGGEKTELAPKSVRYLRCPLSSAPENCQIQ